MKASITILVETLWANRAELNIEAELDNPHSETNQEVVSMLFEAARLMAAEARGENARTLFSQDDLSKRYRELDEREVRLEARDKLVTAREASASVSNRLSREREGKADLREREQAEADVRAERRGEAASQ